MGFTDHPFPGPTASFGNPRFFTAGASRRFREPDGGGPWWSGPGLGRRKDEWAVEFRRVVVVCNGHHTEPRFAEIPAMIFMLIELQAKSVTFPAEEDMMASIDEYYRQMEETGKPKHHTHALYPDEVDFLNWLTTEVGLPPLEEWRIQLYRTVCQKLAFHDDEYLDTLDTDYWTSNGSSHFKGFSHLHIN